MLNIVFSAPLCGAACAIPAIPGKRPLARGSCLARFASVFPMPVLLAKSKARLAGRSRLINGSGLASGARPELKIHGLQMRLAP